MSENILGMRLREARGDMSLRDFAKVCGISHTHLDSIEKGIDPRTGKEVSVRWETLKKLSIATGFSVHYLTGDTDDKFSGLSFLADGSKTDSAFVLNRDNVTTVSNTRNIRMKSNDSVRTDEQKPPSLYGGMSEDDIKHALYGEVNEATDAKFAEVKRLIQLQNERNS